MSHTRVAAFQRAPIFDDIGAAVSRTLADLTWCDANGVDLAVFPECYLQGYATDQPTIARRALSLDDPGLASLLRRLADVTATMVMGIVERRTDRLFNSAMVVSNGAIRGVYSKAHPNEAGVQAGIDFPVFHLSNCSFGINICNDANHPETARRVADNGAEILCYPLNNMLPPEIAALWRARSVENLKARALQTGCWVMSSDVVGENDGLLSYGCTCIVRPDGVVASRAEEGREPDPTQPLTHMPPHGRIARLFFRAVQLQFRFGSPSVRAL
jgi:predicted amidohydrolase